MHFRSLLYSQGFIPSFVVGVLITRPTCPLPYRASCYVSVMSAPCRTNLRACALCVAPVAAAHCCDHRWQSSRLAPGASLAS